MSKLGKLARRFALVLSIGLMTASNSGCIHLIDGFFSVLISYCYFWETTPLIPVSPYFSQKVENEYEYEERYAKVPVLDPVEGEHAPIFCIDPPSPNEVAHAVMRATPNTVGAGGIPFLTETSTNNVRMVVDLIVDKVEECRFYPLVGPARLHKCHYKCTVYFDKTIRSDWPLPFSHTDQSQEVVYIDHDHLIRCAGPPASY